MFPLAVITLKSVYLVGSLVLLGGAFLWWGALNDFDFTDSDGPTLLMGGGPFFLVLILVIWCGISFKERIFAPPASVKTESVQPDTALRVNLMSFAEQHAPQLKRSINELEVLEKDLSQRIQALESSLKSIGRQPDGDPDYAKWKESLKSTSLAKSQLMQDLENAFIAYEKYRLSPDDGTTKDLLNAALDSGKDSAIQAETRFEDLRKEFAQ